MLARLRLAAVAAALAAVAVHSATPALAAPADPAAEKRFAEAEALYKRKRMPDVETIMQSIIAQTDDQHMQAKYFKLLGMAQLSMGRELTAKQSFKSALTLDPTLDLTEAEKGEDSPTSHDTPLALPTHDTLLKVDGTPPDALVLIDGIVLGQARDDFEVQPGPAEIEVRASSYKPAFKKVDLTKGKKTVVDVKLEKAPPEAVKAADAPERIDAKEPADAPVFDAHDDDAEPAALAPDGPAAGEGAEAPPIEAAPALEAIPGATE
jgi:hypothetical protein